MGEPSFLEPEPSKEHEAEQQPPALRPPTRRRRRRSRRPAARGASVRRRLRLVYFVLAAAWGFLTGTVAVLCGLMAVGHPVSLDALTASLIGGAGLVAVVGGLVAAAAYRQATDRLR